MAEEADAEQQEEIADEPTANRESAANGDDAGSQPPGGDDGSLPPWQNPAYRFVFFFLFYLGIVALAYPPIRQRYTFVLDSLAAGTAAIQYYFFRIFTESVSVTDKVIVFQGFAVKIIEECTGVYEVLIFVAAVMAFPTTLANKGIGLGMGIPLLYLFNVVRIAVLILVGKYLPEYFDFMHLYFWQATLILMITSVWLLWITKVVKSDPTTSPVSG